MTALKVLFYLATLPIVLLVGFYGGAIDILLEPEVMIVNESLGYPLYFFPMLGVFKVLGAIILLLPNDFNRIKEWAYAGFTFDFIAASYSHFAVGDPVEKIAAPLVLLVVLAISYFLKDKI